MSEKKIVENSQCRCNSGSTPGVLSVTSQSIIKTSGQLQATEADKTITPFGVCSIAQSACTKALVIWENTSANSKVNGLKYLTENSKIKCSIGGEITFIKSNQSTVKG
ncbi:MAG TPA: DUF4280 domain-containing protein [Flavobacterium sp.]|jgi:hypothetical protein